MLGTFVDIACEASTSESAHQMIDLAYQKIARVESMMSFHDADSEVSCLNREALFRDISVSQELLTVLTAGLTISRTSGGQFDFTAVSPLLARGWLPPVNAPSALSGTWRDVEVSADGRVRFHAPLIIDLGGIAKGFAVDLAVSALQAGGANAGCVNAGGDLVMFGRPRHIKVRHPAQPGHRLVLGYLADCAVCTSGSYFAIDDGARAPLAIVDPRTLALVPGGRSYSVIAKSCMLADALTKVAVFADDDDRGEECVATLRANAARVIVVDRGGAVRWLSFENDAPHAVELAESVLRSSS